MEYIIREIQPEDDPQIALIVRDALMEYGVAGEGTAFADPSPDYLSSDFTGSRSRYFVAETKDGVVGGSGIAPLRGGPSDVCELQKMYLAPEARGKGIGKKFL